MSYNRDFMMFIFWDCMLYFSDMMNMKVISFDDVVGVYEIFD